MGGCFYEPECYTTVMLNYMIDIIFHHCKPVMLKQAYPTHIITQYLQFFFQQNQLFLPLFFMHLSELYLPSC